MKAALNLQVSTLKNFNFNFVVQMRVLGATEVQAKKGFGPSLGHVHYVYVWAASALPPLPAETWSRHQQSTGSH